MPAERVVSFRPRTILVVAGLLLGLAAALQVVLLARTVFTWVLVALFLALAINPGVEWLQRHTGVNRRGAAVGVIYFGVVLVIALVAALVIPTLVTQVQDFVDAVPGYVRDLTHGRGPLGFLERRYDITERVQDAVGTGGGGAGGGGLLSGAGVLLSVGKGIAQGIAAVVTIVFLTLFMLLEWPQWIDRVYGLMPDRSQDRWRRVGNDIYRTVGGYVTGNLLISLICGVVTGIVLVVVGVPYPLALGFIVAVLDLVPLAGATIGGLIVVGAGFATSTTAGVVMAVFVLLYQQVENHILQPIIYGRTVNLSPLAVLIAVLIGAEVAGVLGALGAIPIAGAFQVLLVDALRVRRERRDSPDAEGQREAEAPVGVV